MVNNKLVSLNPEMFGFLNDNDSPASVNIELYANPLDCSTCEMHSFQTFMKNASENYGYECVLSIKKLSITVVFRRTSL
mgnify:CR=1 FL=1